MPRRFSQRSPGRSAKLRVVSSLRQSATPASGPSAPPGQRHPSSHPITREQADQADPERVADGGRLKLAAPSTLHDRNSGSHQTSDSTRSPATRPSFTRASPRPGSLHRRQHVVGGVRILARRAEQLHQELDQRLDGAADQELELADQASDVPARAINTLPARLRHWLLIGLRLPLRDQLRLGLRGSGSCSVILKVPAYIQTEAFSTVSSS